MSVILFLLGILLPTCFGWVIVRAAEDGTPVLGRAERWAWGLVLGPTAMTMLTLCLERLHLVTFTITGFLVPMFALSAVLLAQLWLRGLLTVPTLSPWALDMRRSKTVRVLTIALIAWTALKLTAGAYGVFTVPTYWDDSFNNWNLRGKIFYQTQTFTLSIKNANGVVQEAQGVSSYPPALPLIKTWMSAIKGEWSDAFVNGVHVIWILGLLAAVYFTLRRRTDATVSILGTCAVLSLPLLLLHAFNPYAEIFVASHLFLVIASLLETADASDVSVFKSRMRLLAVTLGLLLFTKNEATVLYAPLIGVLTAWVLWKRWKHDPASRGDLTRTALLSLVIAAALILPWLIYKWTNSLTFGNAKAISDFTISFNKTAFDAIVFQVSHEPNFLLLPFVLPFLLITRWRQAFSGSILLLTLFVLAAVTLQIGIFVCVPSLANEAILQTGLNRGMVQIAPVAVLLAVLLGEKVLRER